MTLFKTLATSAVLSLALVCGAGLAFAHDIKVGTLVIGHPWARQSPMAANVAAGFLKITNTGNEDDRLLKATASISNMAQIHDMKMDGAVMKMAELPDGIVIPAGQTVELKPKSLHIMFMGLTSLPVEGEMFKGTLVFEKAGVANVVFEVVAPMAGMN